MDYTLVLGSDTDLQEQSPIVAFRLDPSLGAGNGDILIATKEGYSTMLTSFSMQHCKVMTRRNIFTND